MKIENCKLRSTGSRPELAEGKIYGFASGETILFVKSSFFNFQCSITKTAGQFCRVGFSPRGTSVIPAQAGIQHKTVSAFRRIPYFLFLLFYF
ncbi:MAG: hypothetical protein WC770_07080 [Phycisphaerae bacterium]|jgi:hypothetical protein